ncbi:hypothetical protein VKT23_014437 [Stygiomarasmius scandens]|uniref:Uncharacterized protein n=1 Tax=Marasmiellus scandens TaxID=2682957 RepID=A0ABR1J452_9AGAR
MPTTAEASFQKSADISTPAECIESVLQATLMLGRQSSDLYSTDLLPPPPAGMSYPSHHQRQQNQSTFRDPKSFVVIYNYTSTIRSLTTTTSATS